MSDKEYKGGMHNGLSTLIKAIETLTHKKVTLPSDEEKLSIIFPSVGHLQVLTGALLLTVLLTGGATTGAVTGAVAVVAATAPAAGNILPTFCLPELSEYALVD